MGGGGGGSYGISISDLGKYEQVAKDALKTGAGEGKRNVFISFASEDLNEVNLLRAQAKNENSDLDFNDRSLQEPFDSKNAEYIKRGIRERIRQSSVTVVYISDSTAGSKWVDWEIRESLALGKGVIALHKGDTAPARLPPSITENRIPVVSWKTDAIMRAIEQAAGT